MNSIKNVIRLAALGILIVSCQGVPGSISTSELPALGASSPSSPSSQPAGKDVIPGSTIPLPTGIHLDPEEAAFLILINDYRAQNGAPPLTVSAELQEDAVWMANDMAAKSYMNHTDSLGRDPFTRMQAFGYSGYNSAGENIAEGNATAQDTFLQWKNSPGHNANMLNSGYLAIGIGRAGNGTSSYGWYWSTPFGSKAQ